MRRWRRRSLFVGTAGLVVLASAGLWIARTPDPDVPTRNIAPATALVAPFSFQLSVADAAGAPAAAADTRPVWQTLRVSSGLTFEYAPAGRPRQMCVAEHVADDLAGILRFREFRGLLAQLPGAIECGPPCAACSELSIEWSLDGHRRHLTISDRCWNTHERLQPLRSAAEGIVAAAYGRVICAE